MTTRAKAFSQFAKFVEPETGTLSAEAGGSGGGVTVYATIDDLPMSGNSNGDLALVSSTNRLYLFTNSGWYSIALINQTPTITGNEALYVLATDGTPTVVTLTGTDPEGVPITWSHVATGLTNQAAVTNTDNVFTITPSTDSANQGEFSITFRASDGVNIGTATSEFTLAFVSPYWDETVLSIGTNSSDGIANSTFVDRSTNAHTVTPTGSPVQTAFHPYLDYWSVEFDGTDDAIQYGDITNEFAFGTGDFTVECFVNFKSVASTNYLISTYNGNNGGFSFYYDANNQELRFRNGDAGVVGKSFTPTTGTWYHLTVSRDSETLRFFANGVQVGTDTTSYDQNIQNENTLGLQIGRYILDGENIDGAYFNGYMSNARVIKGNALYTANFTPPTDKLTAVSGTTLLTCQSNRFIDTSSSSNTATAIGDPKISAFNPFGQESEYAVGENNGSAYFDGSGDYLSITTPPTEITDWWNDDFTIDAWVYPTNLSNWGDSSDPQQRSVLIGNKFATTSANYWSWGPIDDGTVSFYYFNGSANNSTPTTETVKLNQWNHIAFVKNSSGFKSFVNGVGQSSYQTISGTPQSDSSVPFTIGATNGSYALGHISNIRILKGTSLYSSDFTPPTAPVGNTNASLYLPMDNAGIFDKTGNYTLTPVGNASTSTTQTKFADTAIYFDGSGDILTAPAHTSLLLNGTDSTIEGWFYLNSAPGGPGSTAPLISQSALSTTSTSGESNFWCFADGTNLYFGGAGTSTYLTASVSVVPINEWFHLAISVTGGTSATVYVNGSSVTSGSISAIGSDASKITILGECVTGIPATTSSLNGYIENFQILKGVAKYTANFTPPTGAQGRLSQATS